jgi:hypothetical protein
VVKFGAAVIGLDWSRFRRLVDESRGYLFEKLGYTPDLFAKEFKLTYGVAPNQNAVGDIGLPQIGSNA